MSSVSYFVMALFKWIHVLPLTKRIHVFFWVLLDHFFSVLPLVLGGTEIRRLGSLVDFKKLNQKRGFLSGESLHCRHPTVVSIQGQKVVSLHYRHSSKHSRTEDGEFTL